MRVLFNLKPRTKQWFIFFYKWACYWFNYTSYYCNRRCMPPWSFLSVLFVLILIITWHCRPIDVLYVNKHATTWTNTYMKLMSTFCLIVHHFILFGLIPQQILSMHIYLPNRQTVLGTIYFGTEVNMDILVPTEGITVLLSHVRDTIFFLRLLAFGIIKTCLYSTLLRGIRSFLVSPNGDGGGRPSSVMSLGVASVGGHFHGLPASPIGVGSLWEDIDPRSPEPLVVRGGWLWLIWVVRWTTWALHLWTLAHPARLPWAATWWPCGLVSWGVEVWVAGAPTWPIKPPEVYTPFGPDPLGRQAAGCPCQSIGWRL